RPSSYSVIGWVTKILGPDALIVLNALLDNRLMECWTLLLSLSQLFEPTQPHTNEKKRQHADSRCNRQLILSKIEPIQLLFVNVNNRSILSRYSVYSAPLGLWRSGHHSSVVKRNI